VKEIRFTVGQGAGPVDRDRLTLPTRLSRLPIIVDTSAIVALADRASKAHVEVSAFVAATRDPLLVPITVLPEVNYVVTSRLGVHVAIALLESIVRGDLPLEYLTKTDMSRSLELVKKYADSDSGFVDPSIVAVAERLRVARILTLDHKHFHLIRPSPRSAFEQLP
jgi:predicted nucleic acid-binding protein